MIGWLHLNCQPARARRRFGFQAIRTKAPSPRRGPSTRPHHSPANTGRLGTRGYHPGHRFARALQRRLVDGPTDPSAK